MTTLTTIEIEPPYLLFIGDMDYELDAKTVFGMHTPLDEVPGLSKAAADPLRT